MQKYHKLALIALTLCLAMCAKIPAGSSNPPSQSGAGLVMLCDYEETTVEFQSQTLYCARVYNPHKDAVNPSTFCMVSQTGGGAWENIYTGALPRALDFTASAPVFKIKVMAPAKGLRMIFSIKRAKSGESAECPTLKREAVTQKGGEWEEMTFDFSADSPGNNIYRKIVLYFDAGGTSSGESWFFDDIEVPDDDLTALNLFQCISDKPFIDLDEAVYWRSKSITSGRIVPPDKSATGKWCWYVRGSSEAHQTIGLLTQDEANFDPAGKWKDYPMNPVLDVGQAEDFDGWRILGVCPVPMPDKSMYFYYKARPYNQGGTFGTGFASSADGIHFKKLTDHSISDRNPSDVVYHEGKFYYYMGVWLLILDEPDVVDWSRQIRTLNTGDGPANFDSACIFGNRVFRLDGVDKWFMVYHGDASHSDFPHRFHIALSDDLVHWTKVQNTQPLFSRGPRGRWDQGGIWAPEIIEYNGKLYMYYEGWGQEGHVADRDKEYFRPAASRTGLAVCDKQEFLSWCGL